MPTEPLFETLPWYSDGVSNRTDVFEVRTCLAGGAGTGFLFLKDKEVQQSGRYVGAYVTPDSGSYEVKNSTTTTII